MSEVAEINDMLNDGVTYDETTQEIEDAVEAAKLDLRMEFLMQLEDLEQRMKKYIAQQLAQHTPAKPAEIGEFDMPAIALEGGLKEVLNGQESLRSMWDFSSARRKVPDLTLVDDLAGAICTTNSEDSYDNDICTVTKPADYVPYDEGMCKSDPIDALKNNPLWKKVNATMEMLATNADIYDDPEDERQAREFEAAIARKTGGGHMF